MSVGERWTLEPNSVKDLVKKLHKLGEDYETKAKRAALWAGSRVIVNSAKERCPVRTGTLRRSIHSEFPPWVDGSNADDPTMKDPSATTVFIGTDVAYAAYVEFGTSRMQPRPYLRPAFDETKAETLREVRETLAEFIARAAQ